MIDEARDHREHDGAPLPPGLSTLVIVALSALCWAVVVGAIVAVRALI